MVLHGGDDYKFVVVEDNGFVSSYAPRLAGGDHMIMVTVNNASMRKLCMHSQCNRFHGQ